MPPGNVNKTSTLTSLSPLAATYWQTYINALYKFVRDDVIACKSILQDLLSKPNVPLFLQASSHFFISSLTCQPNPGKKTDTAMALHHALIAARFTMLMSMGVDKHPSWAEEMNASNTTATSGTRRNAIYLSGDPGVLLFLSKIQSLLDAVIAHVRREVDAIDLSRGIAHALRQPAPGVTPTQIEELHDTYVDVLAHILKVQGRDGGIVRRDSQRAIDAFHFEREVRRREREMGHAMDAMLTVGGIKGKAQKDLPAHEIEVLDHVCKLVPLSIP